MTASESVRDSYREDGTSQRDVDYYPYCAGMDGVCKKVRDHVRFYGCVVVVASVYHYRLCRHITSIDTIQHH
jgi:hypothetical protein